ncbi:MAG: hypothetical protein Q9160_004647 [Pyrenula sp. 1 TL-2023]
MATLKSHFTPAKIVFYILFWGLHWGMFVLGWIKQADDPRLAPLNMLKLSVWLSRGAGLSLSVDGAMILLPMCRNILRWVRPKLRFLPLDESQWFHRQVAYAMLLFTIIHVTAHYVNFFNVEKLQLRPGTAIDIHYAQAGGITGHIMLLCMLLMYTTAHHRIRQQSFETFWRETEITKVVRHPYDAMEIQFRKPSMKYKAGQWLFIQVPSVSSQQWHPFTITSCPFDPYISIHVRQVGDFTRQLGDALGCGPTQSKEYDGLDPMGMYEIALSNGQKMPKMKIDGPYGAPAEDVFDNEIAILIGTGIGVTPWASILKNIWHLRGGPNPPTRLRRVEFIWVCKDTSSFEWFQTLLSSLEAQSASAASSAGGPEFLRIHTYLTQKLDQDTAANIYLNSVGTDVDPLTELKTRTNFGRPDFHRLFGAMRDGLVDQTYMSGLEGALRTDVGVYFCGPSAAARDIKKAAQGASTRDVRFKFWKEHF